MILVWYFYTGNPRSADIPPAFQKWLLSVVEKDGDDKGAKDEEGKNEKNDDDEESIAGEKEGEKVGNAKKNKENKN